VKEVIYGKKVSVADELRIGQDNVEKVSRADVRVGDFIPVFINFLLQHGIDAASKMAAESNTKLRFCFPQQRPKTLQPHSLLGFLITGVFCWTRRGIP
jgi:hypothetical protein